MRLVQPFGALGCVRRAPHNAGRKTMSGASRKRSTRRLIHSASLSSTLPPADSGPLPQPAPPPPHSAKSKPFIASMGIYVMSARALKELLDTKMPSANDFGNEVRRRGGGGGGAAGREGGGEDGGREEGLGGSRGAKGVWVFGEGGCGCVCSRRAGWTHGLRKKACGNGEGEEEARKVKVRCAVWFLGRVVGWRRCECCSRHAISCAEGAARGVPQKAGHG